ncbi:glycosyltransferase [Microbacterium sp. NPDC080220]|uniref:glycosyltransferase n=1 Tax=Microbacterium sp. NPDC080220 TaxID=3161017 RepID=UPI00343EE46F
MKILLVNTFYPPLQVGGAENSVRELAEDLRAGGHSVAVFTLVARGESRKRLSRPVLDKTSSGIRIYRYATRAVRPYFEGTRGRLAKVMWHLLENARAATLLALWAVIRREDPDIVHINSPGGIGAAAWLAAGRRPVVHTLRDFYIVCTSFRTFKAGRNCDRQCDQCRFARFGVAAAAKRTAAVVSISEATGMRHQSFGAFVDREIQTIQNMPKNTVGPRFAKPASHVTFGFIGRVDDYKGIWIVLEAFQRVTDEGIRFIVAGRGPEEAEARLAHWPDRRVTHVGHIPASKFYEQVDVVVVPSQWHEPFGRVAAEAAGSGCAVIVSGLGGLPEASQGAVRSAIVTDPTSITDWSAAMQNFASFHATAVPESVPSDRPVWARYVEVYREVLADRAR